MFANLVQALIAGHKVDWLIGFYLAPIRLLTFAKLVATNQVVNVGLFYVEKQVII